MLLQQREIRRRHRSRLLTWPAAAADVQNPSETLGPELPVNEVPITETETYQEGVVTYAINADKNLLVVNWTGLAAAGPLVSPPTRLAQGTACALQPLKC